MPRQEKISRVAGLYACPIYGGVSIGEEQCRGQCSIIMKNVEVCSADKCESPWRLCLPCLRQGRIQDAAVVSDAKKGLCEFHLKHGSSAVREMPSDTAFRSWSEAGLVKRRNGRGGSRTIPGRVATAGRMKPTPISPSVTVPVVPNAGVVQNPEPRVRRQHAAMSDVIIRIDRDRIRPFAHQPREYFDEKALQELAESIKEVGQLQPIAVRELVGDSAHGYELVDGQRRWHACGIADVQTMRAFIVTVQDEAHQFEISAVSNFGRCGHTPLEIANAIKRLKEDRGRTNRDVAAILACSELFVSQYAGLLRLHPRIQARMHPTVPDKERLGVTTAIRLSGLPHDLQLKAFDEIVKRRMKLSQAQVYVRRLAEEHHVDGKFRKRKPNDDFRVLYRYSKRVHEDAERFLEMPEEKFRVMFKMRSREERRSILDQLNEDIEALNRIREAIEGSV